MLGAIGDSRAVETLGRVVQNATSVAPQQRALVRALQYAAAVALGQIRDPQSLEYLSAALSNVESQVVEEAIKAIGQIGDDPRLVGPLVLALADENAEVSQAAALALGHAGDARAVEGLVRARVHSNDEVRKAASNALQRIDPNWAASAGAKAVVPHLLNAVRGSNLTVAREGALVLGAIADSRAVETLGRAARGTASAAPQHRELVRELQCAAVVALGQIGDPQCLEHLMTALLSEESRVAQEAIKAICQLSGDSRILDALLAELADENAEVSQAAALALGHAGDARAVEGLVRARVHSNGEVRKAASNALQRIDPNWAASTGAKAVVPHLLNAMSGADLIVAREAALVLGAIGDSRAVESLGRVVRAAANAAPGHRELACDLQCAAAVALGRTGDSQCLEDLAAGLSDQESRVALEAVKAIGQIGGDQAVLHLVEALHHKDGVVRAEAARELRRSSQARALDALIAVVGDEENTVAMTAINSIAQIGGDQAFLYLTWALHHKYPAVRIEAARALARSDQPRALDALIAVIGDEETAVALEAVNAVGRHRDPRAVQPLLTVLGTEDNSLVAAAAAALGEIGEPNCVEGFVRLAARPGYGAVADKNLVLLLQYDASGISHEQLESVIGLAPGTETYTEMVYAEVYDADVPVKRSRLITFSEAKELARQELIRREQDAHSGEPQPTHDEILRVSCDACGAKVRVCAKYRGRRVKCPKCGTVFVAAP